MEWTDFHILTSYRLTMILLTGFFRVYFQMTNLNYLSMCCWTERNLFSSLQTFQTLRLVMEITLFSLPEAWVDRGGGVGRDGVGVGVGWCGVGGRWIASQLNAILFAVFSSLKCKCKCSNCVFAGFERIISTCRLVSATRTKFVISRWNIISLQYSMKSSFPKLEDRHSNWSCYL